MVGNRAGVDSSQAQLVALSDDERVLGNVTFYWWNWWKEILFGLVLAALGLYMLSEEMQLGLGPLALAPVVFGLVYRAKQRSGCVVTDRRIVYSKAGLLANRTKEVRMADIRSIVTAQSGLQSILGTGNVVVDTGGGDLGISARNASELAAVIREQKNELAASPA